MSSEQGVLVVASDAELSGEVSRCRRLEVRGAFEGSVETQTLIVHQGGRCRGLVRADAAEVFGNLEGNIRVRNLIRIRASGSVVGNVQYGSLALEAGGELAAEVRNVPPTVAGDFRIEVGRGKSARITLADITAVDPDDRPEDLRFSVSRVVNGAIAMAGSPPRATETFTQADLAAGKVVFLHDGSAARDASFDVIVSDAKGATSGPPRTVKVMVFA